MPMAIPAIIGLAGAAVSAGMQGDAASKAGGEAQRQRELQEKEMAARDAARKSLLATPGISGYAQGPLPPVRPVAPPGAPAAPLPPAAISPTPMPQVAQPPLNVRIPGK